MKQRQLLKLGYVVALVLIAASLIYVACDTKKPTSIQPDDGAIAVLNKAKPYTIETIKPELKKLLAYLKRNPQTITTEVLAKAAERHATITDLGLSGKFPTEFPLENGNTFEVYIELYDGSVGAGSSIEDAEAYFALDIDRYTEEATAVANGYSFEAEVAATELNKSKGLYRDENSRRTRVINTKPQSIDYFWFLVGGEERLSKANEERIYQEWLNSKPGLAKAQSDPSTIYYWITAIRLDEDHDTASNEEFEIYYASYPGTGTTGAFNATTLFYFNGISHLDASGVSRYYSDVNNTNNTYYLPHAIAVEVLTPDSPAGFKLGAIEDDCSATVHKNDHHGGGYHNHVLYVDNIDVTNDNYAGSGNSYKWAILDDCSNDDDIYQWSGTVSFGSGPSCVTSIVPEVQAFFVKVCLRKGTVADADSWGSTQCSSCNF